MNATDIGNLIFYAAMGAIVLTLCIVVVIREIKG